ncbi:MAG: dTMP kinase [Propioniciclava sp.]
MRGIFVVLEGGDGAGKSTQVRRLTEWLNSAGHPCVATFEPGDGAVNAEIRRILLSRETDELSPRAEALLFAADRAQHVDTLIGPAMERGELVVSDRYVDSTLAYQGAGRILQHAEVATLNDWATGGLVPDLTVLLDLDPADGRAPAGEPDRIESAGAEFHQRVREEFLALAARAPQRYLVLPARQSQDEIAAAVRSRVEELLCQR